MSFLVSLYRKFRSWHFVTGLEKKHRKILGSRSKNYVLTKEQEAQIRAFYGPYAKVDMTAHNFYTEKTGQFHVNYMPDDLHYSRIDSFLNDWWECRYMDNKCFYRQFFQGIRHPEAVASRVGDLWYDAAGNLIRSDAVEALLAREPEIVAKMARDSGGGSGVYFLPGKDFSTIAHKFTDDIVIQRPLQQHPGLASINPSSVNTIRILSLLSEEGVRIYSAILRIGRNGSRVDNASSGGITCGITEDGKLKQVAYTAAGERFAQHPDSGLAFEGIPIPGFDLCVAAVPKLHVQIPRFHLVSWDFAIDTDGQPVLVEANLHYGQLDFHQLNNGPLFGDDTEKVLKMVLIDRKK